VLPTVGGVGDELLEAHPIDAVSRPPSMTDRTVRCDSMPTK